LSINLPDQVLTRLKEISEKFNIDIDSVVKEYYNIYNDNFVQTDPQFKDESDKHAFSMRVIWVKYASSLPTREYEIIPIGFRAPRRGKKDNVWRSTIYALIRSSDKLEKKTIFATGDQSFLVNQIESFKAYKVRLASWGGDRLSVTNLTKFDTPKLLPINPLDMVKKFLNVREIKIADTPYEISKLKDEKFVDEWDLKLIRGVVLNYGKGGNEETGTWAFYLISDESATGEDRLTKDGIVIPNRLFVWLPEQLLKYDQDSELAFLGTVTLTTNKEPRFNAISVIPIHARLLIED
jgi:hypothetical protein